MRKLFTRPYSTPISEAKSLISFEIDTRTKVTIAHKDFATIFGLLTLGTSLSLFLVLGFSQEVSPSDTSTTTESEKITNYYHVSFL